MRQGEAPPWRGTGPLKRSRFSLPGLEAFERRLARGWGTFILPDEIETRRPLWTTDLLRQAGVEIRNNGRELYMRRTQCAPTVYVDGVKVTHLPRARELLASRPPSGSLGEPFGPAQEAAQAVNMIHPASVAAIEVYRGPGETPGEFLDSDAQCGVIVVWTRRGAPRRR